MLPKVVLMKVLHLLRTLLLVPAGSLVSDRAITGILQTCFRICFEPKFSELLRKTAELCLASMIQLFFSRLPTLVGFRVDRIVQQTTEQLENTMLPSQPDTLGEFQTDPPQPHPYTVESVYELLSTLIHSLSPEHHKESMVSISLELITIALETGADAIASSPRLLHLVRGDLTKYLMLLLYSEDVWQFAATLRVCFLLFESMRSQLKLQMEVYLQRLTAISSSDNELTGYERREIALDSVVRLFLVPGLATELYVNYDCDPYCSNLFEDITKMLAKNAFPVECLMGTHLLALDALLTVLNTIEIQCGATSTTVVDQSSLNKSTISANSLSLSDGNNSSDDKCKLRPNRHFAYSMNLPSREELNSAKAKKKLLILGSDQFNLKPKRGIAFLQENNILQTPLNYDELAVFLRENPRLEKRMIGEYISDRENIDVLTAFVRQFDFVGVPIDEALRVYLEAFRLPGEAPLIQRIMEHFAEHWYKSNNSPFVDVDSAFTLAYAILILNTDQHNPNSKRQNAPMRFEDFKKNLNGMNGNGDFDAKLLESIYNNIHNHEIVMPIEQTGLVRENYLWKCLLRRSSTKQAVFIHTQTGALDADLFELIWGPTVSALSFIFDKTNDSEVKSKAVDGFNRCAAIAAYYGMSDVLDNLVISLCKFTTLLTANENPTSLPIMLGRNTKACLALHLVFIIASRHADILRYGWHSLLDCLLQLFRANLLPNELLESEDFLISSRKVYITTKGCIPVKRKSKYSRHSHKRRQNTSHLHNTTTNRELGVFSSFYQYLTTGSSWIGSADEEEEDELKDDDTEDENVESFERDIGTSSSFDRKSLKSHPDERNLLNNLIVNQSQLLSYVNRGQLDEQTSSRFASEVVIQCHIEQLIEDSKFLVDASLTELIKALICATRGNSYATLPHNFDVNSAFLMEASQHGVFCLADQSLQNVDSGISSSSLPPGGSSSLLSAILPETEVLNTDVSPHDQTQHDSTPHVCPPSFNAPPIIQWTGGGSNTSYYSPCNTTGITSSDNCRVFCLELLIRVLMHNRDRLQCFWSLVRYYLADLLLSAHSPDLLVERIVVGFLRLAICLLRRHEVTSQIFTTLYWLLLNHGEQLLYCINPSSSLAAAAVSSSLQANVSSPNLSKPRNTNKKFTHVTRNDSGINSSITSSLLLFKHGSRVGQQVISGLTDLLRNHAADLPDPTTDWKLIFGLLEVCGAGRRAYIMTAKTPANDQSKEFSYSALNVPQKTNVNHHLNSYKSNRGYTSDSEVVHPVHEVLKVGTRSSLHLSNMEMFSSGDYSGTIQKNSSEVIGWTDDNKTNVSETCEAIHKMPIELVHLAQEKSSLLISSSVLRYEVVIGSRDPVTLEQAVDCLAFLIRDPAHITPDNFECAVQALRVFVEACLHLPRKCINNRLTPSYDKNNKINSDLLRRSDHSKFSSNRYNYTLSDSDTDTEQQAEYEKSMALDKGLVFSESILSPVTSVIAVQLLDLISILFTRATSIYTEWTRISSGRVTPSSEECSNVQLNNKNCPQHDTKEVNTTGTSVHQINLDYLWTNCWRPLLQATARLCSDIRRDVRTDALTYLQKALLSPTLHLLTGKQWENCFNEVLFPLLSSFLESIALEEAIAASSQKFYDISSNTNNMGYAHRLHTVEFADPRMRAIPLLTKVYLQHLRPLYALDTFNTLWIRILAYMERYMSASSFDSLDD
ncbi:Golgi-specific brefeldin A-resistance guanine nucleotide exchange factor 1 [Schistosoma japonicum]|uniref:Golgi-specific brefeldin A-resistance guanine nucleotide exchange factor 1 n=1 Tax=Schistosoma japonicum TaxID=6182 RepID=A0A4Z2DK60_SCHJA|nr:Golgi-specific brefeldin A-resistance guanine nucleotide exchange factor 1 [Schistosoma japonicum]